MNSYASSPNLRMSHWENRPTNARCPDKKKLCELGIMVQSHYSNKPSLDATWVWAQTWGRSDDSLYWIRRPMFFPKFFSGGLGGGGLGLKLRSYCRKIFRLPYLSRKYAFSGFDKQLHKNYGTDFHQIWYNGASYHMTGLKENWAFVTSKMRIQEFFLSSSYRWRVRQCSELRCTHMYVILTHWCIYLYILMKLLDVRSQNTTKIHSRPINK